MFTSGGESSNNVQSSSSVDIEALTEVFSRQMATQQAQMQAIQNQFLELTNRLSNQRGSANQDTTQNQQEGFKDRKNKEWNPEEIGLFDPDYESTGAVVNGGKTVFYRDVYAFTDRLDDMAVIRGEEKLCTVIPQTLRGSALIWHSTELSPTEKRGMRIATVEEWKQALIQRFKIRVPIALAKIRSATYTLNDARERKNPREFVQDIMRYSKAANQTAMLSQLSSAWYNLDAEFRRDIPEPNENTTANIFLDQIDAKADIWFTLAERRHQEKKNRYDNQSKRPYKAYDNRSFDNAYTRTKVVTISKTKPDYSDDDDEPIRSHQYEKSNHPRDEETPEHTKKDDTPERDRGNKRQRGSHEHKYRDRSREHKHRNRSCEHKHRGRSREHKHWDHDKRENRDKKPVYIANEDDEPHYASDGESNSESNGEASVNWVGAQAITTSHQCRRCHRTFESNNKVHEHIRKECKRQSRTKSANTEVSSPTMSANTDISLANDSTDKANILLIINSSVNANADIDTGYRFQGWRRVTTSISLAKDQEARSACLDSGASLTLIDRRFFLSQTKGSISIRKMADPIMVRGIGSNRHSTDEYAIISIYFEGIQDGKKVLAHICCEAHIVEKLKANILVGTDVLAPEQMILDLGKREAFIGSCRVTIPIQTRTLAGQSIQQPVHVRKTTVMPPQFHAIVDKAQTPPINERHHDENNAAAREKPLSSRPTPGHQNDNRKDDHESHRRHKRRDKERTSEGAGSFCCGQVVRRSWGSADHGVDVGL